jgi:hypothetical protein
MDERTPDERAMIAELAWSLAMRQHDDGMARIALADYRGAVQLLKFSDPDPENPDPVDYRARLQLMAAETETEPDRAAQQIAPPPAVPQIGEPAS